MTEPPLPIIPTPEPREFAFVFPTLSGETPVAQNDCQVELFALIDTVNADPTIENMNALIDFIEEQTGSVIEELAGDVWADVMADGQQRTATVECCGALVGLVIDGTLVAETTCEGLSQYVLELDQQDFHIDSVQIGEFTSTAVTGGVQTNYLTGPSYDVHLEHPKLVWFEQDFETSPLTQLWGGGNGNVIIGGTVYTPTLRVNGYYTATPSILRGNKVLSDPDTAEVDTWDISLEIPPLGLSVVRRAPEGTVGELTVEDPLRIGDPVGTGNPIDNQGVADTDYCIQRFGFSGGVQQNGTNGFVLNQAPGAAFEAFGKWPYESVEGHITPSGTSADAWEDLLDALAAWNAGDGNNPYSPDVSANSAEHTITVSFMTPENAIYMPAFGCEISGGAPTEETLKYHIVAVNWGDYIVHASGYDAAPHLYTNNYSEFAHRNDFMEGVQERIARGESI